MTDWPTRVANVHTVKTAFGATAVQIVWFSQRGSRASSTVVGRMKGPRWPC